MLLRGEPQQIDVFIPLRLALLFACKARVEPLITMATK